MTLKALVEEESQKNQAIDRRCHKWGTACRLALGDRGDFRASSVEILVFASPTGYMLTSSGFPLLNWGIFYKFRQASTDSLF